MSHTMEEYFSMVYYQTAPKVLCSVVDGNGNHCPEPVTHVVEWDDNEIINLCDRCYENYVGGTRAKELSKRKAILAAGDRRDWDECDRLENEGEKSGLI